MFFVFLCLYGVFIALLYDLRTKNKQKNKIFSLQLSSMLLPTPPGCISSTSVCVSSGGCVSSENFIGVPISYAHASEVDSTLPLVALFHRPVLIPGTIVPTLRNKRTWVINIAYISSVTATIMTQQCLLNNKLLVNQW